MVEQLINGFIPLLQPSNILAIVGGSVVGYLVGALPG
jgi:TctA family transporter